MTMRVGSECTARPREQLIPFARELLICLAALAVLGCAAKSPDRTQSAQSVDSNSALAGTYYLRTVNGAPVPATVAQAPGQSLRIISGKLTLSLPDAYTLTATQQKIGSTSTAPATVTCLGTYKTRRTIVAFIENRSGDCNGSYEAEWDGDRKLAIAFDGNSIRTVFEK